MELKICMFLFTLFWNEDFISQESTILADVEKINFWFRIEIFFEEHSCWPDWKNSLHKKADFNVDISNLQGTINREFVQRKFANGL